MKITSKKSDISKINATQTINIMPTDSDNDSDNADKKVREDNNRTINATLKITPGFLPKQNGIFRDSKDNYRTPTQRKMEKASSLSSRDYSRTLMMILLKPTILYSTKFPNKIKALSGRKFIGDVLTTYKDAIRKKKKAMLQISGFITNVFFLDEVRSTCQVLIDQLVDI